MPQGPMSSPLMRPLVVLALPGMYLFYKYNQYKRRQQETARRRLTERELQHLNHKICQEQRFWPKSIKLAVLGANSNCGEALAMLLMQSPRIARLSLYDEHVEPVEAIVNQLMQLDTAHCQVTSHGDAGGGLLAALRNSDLVMMLGEELLPNEECSSLFQRVASRIATLTAACISHCPQAIVVVCAAPVTATLPLVSDIYHRNGLYQPGKLIGSCALEQSRANAILAAYNGLDARSVHVPLLGGPHPKMLVPLLSQASPRGELPDDQANAVCQLIANAMQSISEQRHSPAEENGQVDGTPLSRAYALSGLAKNIASAICGGQGIMLTGFVRTNVCAMTRYFATDLLLGPQGIVYTNAVPRLSSNEVDRLEAAIAGINLHADMAREFLELKTIHLVDSRIATK